MLKINQKLETATAIIQSALKIYAPKDTGNLSVNGIRCVYESGIWYVVVGGEVAPYAIYTNEPWNNGVNPNEGWIQQAISSVSGIIANLFQDKYTEQELSSVQNDLSSKVADSIKNRIRGVL